MKIRSKNAKITINGIPLSTDVKDFQFFKRDEVNRTTSVPGQKIFDEIIDDTLKGAEPYTTTIGKGMFSNFEFQWNETEQTVTRKDDTIELHQNEDGVWTNEPKRSRLLQPKT